MSTVNISFNDDLLKQIDKVAEEESRTRSELIREAARNYIQRKDRWGQIFQLGSQTTESKKLKPVDIEKEIAAYRKTRRS
jgi:CopG family transcriptional regulator/antitoxin EndoAI